MPGANAAQQRVARSRLPHRAELPAKRAADRLQDGRIHLDRPVGFREYASDGVLNPLKVADVGEPCVDWTDAHR